jgi:hypothetical protein
MRRSVFVVLVLALATSVASAQPGLTQPGPPGLTPPTYELASPAPTGPRKDPSTAVLLSLGITTASYVTLFAAADGNNEELVLAAFVGTYLGPSTGQWYAGKTGGLGLGLRAAGFVSAVYGFSLIMSADDHDCLGYDDAECAEIDDESDSLGTRGAIFFWGGAALWFGSSIYDIVLAKRAADSWNARHNVGVAPMVARDASGSRTPGLVLTGRF